MQFKLKTVATGSYLPQEIVTNFDLEKLVDTNDEWITTRTGIKERRKASEDVATLAYNAALDAINSSNYNIENIDLIIVATITAEQKSPSVASLVQSKLGLNNKKVMAFDINAACSGFVYALELAASLLGSNKYQSALIIGSEKMSSVMDYTDRNTCILFGDGAGSMIVEPSKSDFYNSYFYNDSKGDDAGILTVEEYLKMNGPRVYQFAIDIIPKAINELLKQTSYSLNDIDVYIPHQANLRIIESMINSLGVDSNKVFINIEKYGNTSAASIPIAIDEYKKNNLNSEKNVLLVGFGGGFTWGAAILRI